MRLSPVLAATVGVVLYGILIAVFYGASSTVPDSGSSIAGVIEVIALLLAWFLPALVAGGLSQHSPLKVGLALGLALAAVDFVAKGVAVGLEFAVVTIVSFPFPQIFTGVSAVVFAYAGWRIRAVNSPPSKRHIA